MRYLSVFLILFFLIGHFACEDCSRNVLQSVALKDLVVLNYKETSESDFPVPLNSSENVDWDDVVIRFAFDFDLVAQANSRTSSVLYADCISPGEKGTGYGIESVDVITLNDYNVAYERGDTINTMLQVEERYTYDTDNSVDGFEKRHAKTFRPSPVELRFTQQPLADVQTVNVRVVIVFKNDSTYTAENETIQLTN